MKLTLLKIKGFRSFGPDEVTITLNDELSAFIGLNSSGKTAALEALRKLFGSAPSEREIYQQDFHLGKDENPDDIDERNLSIEVRLDFSEDEDEAIPHFFSNMIVDEEEGKPYIRLRLEASWNKSEIEPEGIINYRLYFINVAEDEEDEESKQLYPNHLRSLVQIFYVPAIRRPAEQLKYASGSILYRVLRKIKWDEDFKDKFDEKIEEINDDFRELPELVAVQKSITSFWEQFHKDERYSETTLGFGGSDFDSILRKLEISFSPTPTHRKFNVNDLGEGYRSLFYLTLVCSFLNLEDQLIQEEENIGINRPLLTILAIEEPENHIAPQLLGRVIKILKSISHNESAQVVISSHTPAIVKRIDPESIFHFRINEEYQTEINKILLPEDDDEAYKYVKEAVYNYPEIYFAKLVVIGEGDSEEVIFNRLMKVIETDFDDNLITFAPLGHRFVNHIWKLLKVLHIPYITLLDLDVEREGGGWGRVKYIIMELIKNGYKRENLLKLSNGSILSFEELKKMHSWSLKTQDNLENFYGWVDFLKKYNVYFSKPLDIDFLMLQHYTEYYQRVIPKGGGPRIPDQTEEPDEFNKKIETAIQATLKSGNATASTYSEEEKELMIWYNYLFLGRGKPTAHIQVLSSMTDEEIDEYLPSVFKDIFNRIESILKI